MNEPRTMTRPPGTTIPWEEKLKEMPTISGDGELVERVWKQTDSLGYMYIYFCLLAF